MSSTVQPAHDNTPAQSSGRAKKKSPPPALKTLPDTLQKNYTQVPMALYEHGEAIGVTKPERDIIEALWSFKYYADSRIFPSQEAVAKRAWCKPEKVASAVRSLAAKDLLEVERRAGPKSQVKAYKLNKLWKALADHAEGLRPGLKVIEGGAQSIPENPGSDDVSTSENPGCDPGKTEVGTPENPGWVPRKNRDEVVAVEADEVQEDERKEGTATSSTSGNEDVTRPWESQAYLDQLCADLLKPNLYPRERDEIRKKIEAHPRQPKLSDEEENERKRAALAEKKRREGERFSRLMSRTYT